MSNLDFRVKNGLVVEQAAVVSGSVTASSFIGSGSGLTGLYSTSAFSTDFNSKSTTNLSEGSNLYYTDARVSTYLTSNNFVTKAQAEADAVALSIALG